MKKLLDNTRVPPGGWKFTVPANGYMIRAHDLPGLLQEIIKHMEANKLPFPDDLAATVEDQVCQAVPTDWIDHPAVKGVYAPYKGPIQTAAVATKPTKIKMPTMTQIKAFTKVLLGPVKKRAFINQLEVDRRTAICKNCPLNKPNSGCQGCNASWVRGLVSMWMRPQMNYVKNHPLHVCLACGCILKIKIWLRLVDIKDITTEAQIKMIQKENPKCWIISE